MGIRTRLQNIGRTLADAALDRVESAVQGLRAPEAPRAPPAPSAPGAPMSAPTGEEMRAGNVPGATLLSRFDGQIDWTDEQAIAQAMQKAQASGPLTSKQANEPRALYWDPYSLVEQLGYKEKPSALTYATLATMVWKVPLLNAIIQTRVNQVATFCTPQASRFEHGFRIKMRDPKQKPSKQDIVRMREIEQLILTTGYADDARERQTFEAFIRKIVRDLLIYDQVNFEIVADRMGRPAGWYAVDAATIRLADTYRLTPSSSLDDIRTVQVFDTVVIAEFTQREMAFEVMNPKTDIRSQGYGTSPIEMLVSSITQLLWAINHNASYFSQGTATPGILNLKGAIPPEQMRAFRKEWFQMISGASNAWRTPITNADEIQWIQMDSKSNRDMEWAAWLDFLIKTACGVFQMDPIEIGFKYGSGGSSKAMFGSADKTKQVESRQKGLKPILRFLEAVLDRHLIWPMDPRYIIEFVGLEQMTPKELADLNTQRVRTLYTIDEMRAENDLEPLPNGLGEVILDANWLSHQRMLEEQKQQQALQAQQAQLGAPGSPGAPGAPGSPSAPGAGGAPSAPSAPGAGGAPKPQPSGKELLPGQEAPAPKANVGALASDPATPEQIRELRDLLEPKRTQKSQDASFVSWQIEV